LSSINHDSFSWNIPWTACNSWRQKFLEKKTLSLVVPTVATIGHCLDKHCTVVNLPSWVLIVLFWKMIIVIFYPCKHLGLMYSVKLPKSFAQKSMVVSLPSPIQKKCLLSPTDPCDPALFDCGVCSLDLAVSFFFFLIFRPILQFTKRASSEIVNVFKVLSCLPQIHLCKSQKR